MERLLSVKAFQELHVVGVLFCFVQFKKCSGLSDIFCLPPPIWPLKNSQSSWRDKSHISSMITPASTKSVVETLTTEETIGQQGKGELGSGAGWASV